MTGQFQRGLRVDKTLPTAGIALGVNLDYSEGIHTNLCRIYMSVSNTIGVMGNLLV